MDKKIVNVIGTVGIPACYGGFESLVQNLVEHQNINVKYRVFCSSKTYSKKQKKYKNADLVYIPLHANGISSIFYDILSLSVSLFKKSDITLILGVSGCLFLPIFKTFSNTKIITNIDGLEWKRDKWNPFAKKFLKLSERFALKYSDVIITDNQAISDYVLETYSIKSNVIAYGGDHAIPPNVIETSSPQDYYLSICRIEPENNIHLILDAFSCTSYKIKFVGNWNSSQYGLSLREKYSNYHNIELLDPIYDKETLFRLRKECKGYIHGHSAGGTNPSLVEAMHFGMPIFIYSCIFNKYSTDNKGILFSNKKDLIKSISDYEDNIIPCNGTILKNIANEKYCWGMITQLYENLYI